MGKKNEKFQVFEREGMHIIHLNVRSLYPKMSEVRKIAEETNALIIGISETWLDSSVEDFNICIEGYTVIRKDRENKLGGGVCMYISNKIAFTQPVLDSNHIESVWAKVFLPKTKPVVVSTVYSTRKDIKNFFVHFKQCLECLSLDRLDCVILGDFNIGLDKDSSCKKYGDILNSFGLKQLINRPTRISETRSSLIDHILVKQTDEKIDKAGTIIMGLSDHNMIYCTRKISPGQIREDTGRLVRNIENFDFNLFVQELKKINWTSFTTPNHSVHKNWKDFHDAFLKIIADRSASVRSKEIIDPWMNNDMLKLSDERDMLFNKFVSSRENEDYKPYSVTRNSLTGMYLKARSKYICEKIEKSKDNPKMLKQQLKDLGFINPKKEEQKKALYINDDICHDDLEIADHFNTFFITVASDLVAALPTAKGTYSVMSDSLSNFYSKRNSNNDTLTLGRIKREFVDKEFRDLDMEKGTSLDKIPADFLELGASELKKPMTSIINQSLKSGIVPESMKQTRVKPLLKKGSLSQDGALKVENYRPVTTGTPNVLSEILEKHVVCKLEDFLHTNNMLYEFQSGFRSGFSADTCIINLLDYVRDNNSKGSFTGMLMLNLQQAFDTVDHKILCKKLEIMRILSPWFESYLTGRTQVVECGGVLSESKVITRGLPKGSMLGRLLFLCYINDLPISIDTDCKLILYEDNIAILYSHEDTNEISKKLRNQFVQCSKWLIENKLILKKTECILFGPMHKLERESQFKVRCCHNIKASEHIKYLGVTIDKFLKFDLLVKEIEDKIKSRLKFLKRKENKLNIESRSTLASELIQPWFDCCSSAWYESLSKSLKNDLQVVQDNTIRYIKNRGSKFSINCHILDSINTLCVADQVRQFRLEYVHNIIYSFAPKYLKKHFDRNENDAEWASNQKFPVPRVRDYNRPNFYYHAILDWNSLPLKVKKIKGKARFISEVKLHLAKEAEKREKSKSK